MANLILTGPGDIELTLIPNSPSSLACCCVKCIIAAFDVPYAILSVDALNPDIEAIFTMFSFLFF